MILILKLFLAPLLLGIASIAGRIWGDVVAGLLIALPIIAGPILFILAYEHGVQFGAVAAKGALIGIVQFAVFSLIYAFLSRQFNPFITLLLSWGAVAATIYILQFFHLPLFITFSLVLLILIFTLHLLPKAESNFSQSKPPYWEIFIRMLAAMILVFIITTLAEKLGPTLSGLLASFPIASSVCAVFLHCIYGHDSVIRVTRGFIIGLFGFSMFFLVLAVSLPLVGLVLGFLLASVIVLVCHLISFHTLKNRT